MRKWKSCLIFCLLVCLLVAGCSRKQTEEEGKKGAETVKDAVFMAVGEETVYGQEAMAYVYFLKHQYETGLGQDIWSLEIEEGTSFEDYAKEAVISNITQLKILCQQAVQEEVSLDEEEAYEAEKAAANLLEAASEEDIKQFGLSKEVLAGIYRDNALAAKFFDVTTAQVDTDISDAEAKQITIQYAAVLTEGLDENQKKEAKKEARKLLAEAEKTSSFLNFASSNSDSETVELTFGAEDSPEEFGQAALELKTGEISKVIEGEQGYYILYCITDFNEEATTAKKEEIIDTKRDALFREKYKEWSEHYKVVVSTTLWAELSFTQENTLLKQK